MTASTEKNKSADSSRWPSDSSVESDRRTSDTWDASKVPPSQFQRRRGSLLATPSSKDGGVERGDRDKAYFAKLKEKGWSGK